MDWITKEQEEIKKEILKHVEEGQLITYIEFLELYKPYKERISEIAFANLLGISNFNYQIFQGRGTRTKIFKKIYSKLTQEEQEEIKKEILKHVEEGQLITYIEFLTLYKTYEERISEIDFANLLGISEFNYQKIRYRGTRTKIFKKTNSKLTEEQEEIKKEILKNVRIGQLITYIEFLELYKPYEKRISEIDFAKLLGISYNNFQRFRYPSTKVKIFKKTNLKLTEEEQEEIRQEILKQVKEGQLIKYSELLELYKPYKERISEIDFAKLLGINYSNYKSVRNRGTKAKIKDYKKEIKINGIRYLLQESRYYSKQELENLSKKYEIDLSEILKKFFNLQNNKNLKNIEDCLEIKGQLWIGNIKCSKIFAEKYAQFMIETAMKIGNNYCRKYKCESVKDDVISNSIIFIIEKRGHIEKNCITEEQIKTAIFHSISRYIMDSFLWEKSRKCSKIYSYFEININGEEINPFDKGIVDASINVENEVIENMSQAKEIDLKNDLLEDSCLRLLKKYLEIGYDENKAILEVSKIVKIAVKPLVKILKKYMIKQQYVKVTSKGSYILKY
ncbi:MAG TPA: hypothetical protein IAC20_06535 [Candidatus Faecisoma merdavium]|nr:hypothetical protein [Candidatus Faecisoma merdavium]